MMILFIEEYSGDLCFLNCILGENHMHEIICEKFLVFIHLIVLILLIRKEIQHSLQQLISFIYDSAEYFITDNSVTSVFIELAINIIIIGLFKQVPPSPHKANINDP